ncbi:MULTISPECIES: hypothetical protein [Acinetobacter]|nr:MULTISPECIES: hypothetical protein [Acinetobacter]UNT63248.1 hypothetical protein IHE36_03490 [Acinetobacter towneri]
MKTPVFRGYMDQISGVVNYVNQTFSLFADVEEVQPKKIAQINFKDNRNL